MDRPANKISADEAIEMIEGQGALVLDVRPGVLRQGGFVRGSISFPFSQILRKSAEEMIPDKDAVVIVYCQAGIMSEMAAKMLATFGYRSVYDAGGIFEWPKEWIE